jgi:hypothetical protein
MAWQQRVGQELHAYRRHYDKFHKDGFSTFTSGF